MGALRLFLALVVAFDHTRSDVLRPKSLDVDVFYALGFNAGYAVMYFYIISGFLISFVIRHKYLPGANGTLTFYRSRFIRIFSLYWPIALLTILCVHESRTRFLGEPIVDKFTNLFLFGVDWNLAFVHYPAPNTSATIWLLDQAWTLGAELSFYLLAPFVLRSPWLSLGVLLTSASIRAATVSMFGFSAAWTYWFLPSTILFFMLGHFAGVLSERARALKYPFFGWLLAVGCVLALMLPTYVGWDAPRFWLAIVCFSLALPGVFAGTKDNRLLNMLGNLSFPVYLVHLLAIGILERVGYFDAVFGRFKTSALSCQAVVASVLALSLVMAVIAHRFLEKPTSRALRAVFRSRANKDGGASSRMTSPWQGRTPNVPTFRERL